MARAHDIEMGTKEHKCTADKLPENYSRESEKEIMAEYTTFLVQGRQFLRTAHDVGGGHRAGSAELVDCVGQAQCRTCAQLLLRS